MNREIKIGPLEIKEETGRDAMFETYLSSLDSNDFGIADLEKEIREKEAELRVKRLKHKVFLEEVAEACAGYGSDCAERIVWDSLAVRHNGSVYVRPGATIEKVCTELVLFAKIAGKEVSVTFKGRTVCAHTTSDPQQLYISWQTANKPEPEDGW